MHYSQLIPFFNEVENNERITQSFLSYAGEEFELPGFVVPKPYVLMKCVHSNEYRIVTRDREPRTVFFIRLLPVGERQVTLIKKVIPRRKKLTHCMVWSSLVPDQSHAFQYVATKFFEYFINDFDLVLAPGTETLCAAHFWEGRLLWSLTHPHVKVYHIDNLTTTATPLRVKGWLEFMPLWTEFIWESEKDIDPLKLILITRDKPKH